MTQNFSRKKSVLILVRYLSTVGGIEKMTVARANSLSKRGHNVDVLVVKGDGKLEKKLSNEIKVKSLSRSKLYKCIPDLVNYLSKVNPDVLISSNFRQNIVSVCARLMSYTNSRLVLVEHLHISEYLSRKGTMYRFSIKLLISLLYPLADVIAGVSEGVVVDLKRLMSFSIPETKVLPNPVIDDEVYEAALEDPRHRWLEDEQKTVILGVGRLHQQKNFPLLIRAFARASQQKAGLHLIILGKGQQRQALESLVSQLDLSDVVDFLGHVDNPYSYMARADLFVLSSNYEGFGNVVVEALACGCPVVSTDCPSGPREILEDGKWGLLVPVGDAEALSAAMIETLNQEHNREAYKKRGAMFSVENSIGKYEEVLFSEEGSKGPSNERAKF